MATQSSLTKQDKLVLLGTGLAFVAIVLVVAVVLGTRSAATQVVQPVIAPIEANYDPYQLVNRAVPNTGAEMFMIASDIDAFGQTTLEGTSAEIEVGCRSMVDNIVKQSICNSEAFDNLGYMQWTNFQYDERRWLSFAAGYFGNDAAIVQQVEATDTDIVEEEITTESMTASETVRFLRNAISTGGVLGQFNVDPRDDIQYFEAEISNQTIFVWKHGDWVYMVSAPDEQTVKNFVSTTPF